MLQNALPTWSVSDAREYYEVDRWGQRYFSIGENGNLRVHPDRSTDNSIDLKELVDGLQMRGLQLPVLIRFNGILADRLREIAAVFQSAIEDHGYQGGYRCFYPIKVNQQRQVVEEIVRTGRELGFGLEAGSKPELLAVVAVSDDETPIICNGFKDREFIEMAMLAQKMGRRVIPVVERYSELGLILQCAEQVGVRPEIGVRVKLAAAGSGRWQASGGRRSKFGLTVSEILCGLDELQGRGMADCLKLLHFHLGSQVTNIRRIKTALIEATRVYCELHKRGAGLQFLDVGGGLGVDYDGSQTNYESSMNYTVQEYANDVVYHIRNVCDDAGAPHPDIISESGRAIVAYHSVLVFNVLGVSGQHHETPQTTVEQPDTPQPLQTLRETLAGLTVRNLQESFHDAQQALDAAMSLFGLGHLSLEQRGESESLFWAIARKIHAMSGQLDFVPEEFEGLERLMSDTYFCNFSLFQSLPDSWAISQLFPVMPIHRLDSQPTHHAVLGDITCDSDGKIDRFIDRRSVKRTLALHTYDGAPYFLGAFLIGAYQEILGDLHNLFGDTNAVHVNLGADGDVRVEAVIKGDTVSQTLGYLQYERTYLIERLQSSIETAIRQERLDHREAGRFLKFYEDGLNGYTYLEEHDS